LTPIVQFDWQTIAEHEAQEPANRARRLENLRKEVEWLEKS